MAVGFPTKANWAAGDVLTASALDDLAGTVNTVQYLKPWNQVLNSNMSVWQRGTSFAYNATYTQYTADRWQLVRGATATGATVTRQLTNDTSNLPNIQYCSRIQRDAGNTSTQPIYFYQTFETVNSIPYAGKTVTLSYYARKGANYSNTTFNASVFTGTGTDQNLLSFTGSATPLNADATPTTTWQRFTTTGTISASTTEMGVFFTIYGVGTAGAADYIEITGVQLEQGSVANTYQPNQATYQGELAACQRYYFRYTPGVSYGKMGGYAYSTSTTNVDWSVTPKVTMRVMPTSVDFSNIQLVDTTTNGSTGTASAIGIDGGGASNEVINAYITTSGATSGRSMIVRNNNNTAGYIGFSSEL